MSELGVQIAQGRTSDVFAFGVGAVVKVPRPSVPVHWARIEAEKTHRLHSAGLPTPAVLDLITIKGRESIVFERIDGLSMWQQILDRPDLATANVKQFAEIQFAIMDAATDIGFPLHKDLLRAKIDELTAMAPAERSEAKAMVTGLPNRSTLCHGDMHPGNILMSTKGPIVIDWFDAAVGHPIADIVRTSLLIRPPARAAAAPHLPGANAPLLEAVHRVYVDCVAERIGGALNEVARWEAVLAMGRLAEDAGHDDEHLLALWNNRHDSGRRRLGISPLMAELLRVVASDNERPKRVSELR